MSEQPIAYPSGWAEDGAYHPEPLNLKGKDYVTVAERVAWFVHDQRQLIAAGLATTGYSLRTELVEHNPTEGFAHYAAIVRDVLGNEATMYGSCTRKSFADYLEKAATKALGRALLLLGYGTAFLDELDEGEIGGERKPVDAPQARQRPQAQNHTAPQQRQPAPAHSDAGRPTAAPADEGETNHPATEQQAIAIKKLCDQLKRSVPVYENTYTEASRLIQQLSAEARGQTSDGYNLRTVGAGKGA